MDVGEKIKIALEAKGMSQKELSEKAHATEASISRYINGERYPKWQIVKRIADVLDVSLDWLADRKTEPQTNADQHVQHVGSVESVEPTWTKEEHEAFYTFLWNVINPNEMQDYIEMFETKDEPQKWEKPPKFEHKGIQTACVSVPMALIEDEPQTEEWYNWRDEQEYNDRWESE